MRSFISSKFSLLNAYSSDVGSRAMLITKKPKIEIEYCSVVVLPCCVWLRLPAFLRVRKWRNKSVFSYDYGYFLPLLFRFTDDFKTFSNFFPLLLFLPAFVSADFANMENISTLSYFINNKRLNIFSIKVH